MVTVKIVWREHYRPDVVRELQNMGTLPRNEIELDLGDYEDGADVVERILNINLNDGNVAETGDKIAIIEPEKYAGTYEVAVDYDPVFTVGKIEEDD